MLITFCIFFFNGCVWIIRLIGFHNDAKNQVSRLAMKAYFILSVIFYLGIVVMIIFLILAVKYD